jgi:hypothetical protein
VADATHEAFAAFDDFNCSRGDGDARWFVYLLPLTDCTAFKVGFSCNPLRRLHAFSARYFEQFDLFQAQLLRVANSDTARALESSLKDSLSDFQVEAPRWVPREAGGHTEWFSAVQFPDARTELLTFSTAHALAHPIDASNFVRETLVEFASSFELWSCAQAQRLFADAETVALGYEPTVSHAPLRDWLDAYRFFAIGLFNDDPQTAAFVAQCACRSS